MSEHPPYTRILVATGGAPHSQVAVQRATRLARHFGAPLHVITVVPQGATPLMLDYFPDDFVTFIDESHVTVPQIGGMANGDRARKQTLVDYGFRLPSAMPGASVYPLTGGRGRAGPHVAPAARMLSP